MDAQERTDPAQSREAGYHVRESGARRLESSATVFPHASAARGSGRSVPFFPSASDALGRQGFVRVINHTAVAGKVTIGAFDDEGASYGPLTLSVGTGETVHFDSGDLEDGNGGMGLSGSTGPGEGNWRLELESELDIEILSYIRTADGFLTAMQDTVPVEDGRHRVATFNPGSNASQVSLLRLVNPGDEDVEVSIAGVDDRGTSPADEGATAWIPAGASRVYTAAELESGNAQGLEGSIGNGAGKWRLVVESGQPVVAMSLLSSPTGHMTNLSTVPTHESGGVHRVPLFPPAFDPFGQQGFVRVVNRSDAAGEVRIEAFDDTAWTYDAPVLSIGAGATVQFNSEDLEFGNADRGLVGSTGTGQGNWRLRLTSELDIEVLSYVRTEGDGYSPMHDTATRESEGLKRYYVPLFHGAGHETQESRLLLVNLDTGEARVGIGGLDDAGTPPEGDVSLVLAAGQARMLTAGELEQGGYGLDGRFGRGSERWRLFVAADRPLHVMSLGYGRNGFLANLSRRAPAAELEGRPDVVVAQPSVNDDRPEGGGTFTLSATVRNRGDGEATATTLRYYRSANAAITTADEEVGTDAVGGLAASASSDESVALSAPSDPGDHYYGACVDAVAGESDATNNCSARVRVRVRHPRHPDLVVDAPSVDDTTPDAGAEFTLSATVRNRGDGDATTTTLRYFRSSNAAISTGDAEVGTDAVAGLAPSGSGDESITLTAPSDPGAYYYGACVDAVAGESDTANNCSGSVQVTVPEPVRMADLVVETPAVSESEPQPGASIKLSATVRNQGDEGSGSAWLHFYHSADAGIATTDAEVGRFLLEGGGGVAASASSEGWIRLRAPSDPGTYHYGACVDTVTEESDTSNNCSSSVQVTPTRTTFPDLVVDAPAVSESEPDANAPLTLSATVRNRGDGDARTTTLRYYRSADAVITTADAEVDTDAVGKLAASGTSDESARLSAPPDPGTYYYGACVDAVTWESDATNNCSAPVPVTVPAPAGDADLVVDGPPLGDGDAGGGEFTVSATVRNRGGTAAANTVLVFYHSRDAHISTGDSPFNAAPADDVDVPALAPSGTSNHSALFQAPSSPGAHYYGACVDAVPGESDTTNNCSAAIVLIQPELRAESVALDDSFIHRGADVGIYAVARNVGTARSASTTLRYYHSADAAISTSDTEVAAVWVPKLEVPGIVTIGQGSAMGRRVTVTGPSDVGVHYYGACVDAVPGEADTTDNCSEAYALEVILKPDLVVRDPSVSESNPEPDMEFTLSVTVSNEGDADSLSHTTLRYYRSVGTTISTSDVEVGTSGVGVIRVSDSHQWSLTLNAPSSPGIYFYGACVDAVSDESNKNNNCSPSVQVEVGDVEAPGRPDLEVGAPTASDTSPETGGSFTLTATVTNAGDAGSAATTLRYYRSTDATISTSDTQVGTDPVGALAAGGTSPESIPLTAPGREGAYYYRACVDAVSGESDTTDNCSPSVQVEVGDVEEPGHPDLEVGAPTASDTSPETGGSFTLSATVTNAGDAGSAATPLRYYRSTDATISTSDTQVGTDPVGALAAGGTSPESIPLTAPGREGAYYYGACVDAVADESDTANNCSSSVTVTVTEPPKLPDLVVEAPSVDDTTPDAGAEFTLSATVRNRGDAAAAATTLRYYRSIDWTISRSDMELGTDTVAGLAPSGSGGESITLTAPSDPGAYYYGACVDAVAGESDTANNCSGSVQVTVPEPARMSDLVVGTPAVSESEPHPGASIRLSATVRNQGDEGSGSAWLYFYRSADAAIATTDAEVGRVVLEGGGGIAASASSEGWIRLRAPSDPGTYHYGACVDTVTEESDTSNNCSSSVQVTPTRTTFPDLVVDAPAVSESEPDANAPLTLSAKVRNRGDGDARTTTLRYYRSADAVITTADAEVDTDAVGKLAASGTSDESARLSAPPDPGTYYYGACVDAVTWESDATNNCSAPVPVTVPAPAGDADLVVDGPPLGDGDAGGGEFTVSATVRNRGGTAAANTVLVFYHSRDAHISTGDSPFNAAPADDVDVPALAPSGTSNHSALFQAPSSPGAHYYGACVDAVPGESDTTNNCSAAIVLIQPELRAESVALDDSFIDKGADVGIYAEARNVGTARSASTTLRYYHSADAAISTSDTEVAAVWVPKLEVPGIFTIGQGSAMGRRVTVTGPSDVGVHYYGACVDAVPGEADTTNNCSEGYRVQVFGKPDLVVRDPSVSESNPEPDTEFTLSATVSNQGDADSLSHTTLRYYRSVGTRISTSDVEVGTSWVGVIRVSRSYQKSLTLNAPSSPGTYFYGACVDAVSDESNKNNNCSSAVRVTVVE